MVGTNGTNLLHWATLYGADLECIKWVMANVTIDINVTNNYGDTPIMFTLLHDELVASKYLVEHGANIFLKDNDGDRAIDYGSIGPQILLHAKQLRWSAVKECILLSQACKTPARRNLTFDIDDDEATFKSRMNSVRLVTAVLSSSDLKRTIASFLIRSDLIIRDPSIPKPSDAVKLRVEATLAAASSSTGGGSDRNRARSD